MSKAAIFTIKTNKPYRVRFVGEPYRFFVKFERGETGFIRKIISAAEYREIRGKSRFVGGPGGLKLDVTAHERYGVIVIDRTEPVERVAVLEGPAPIFKEIALFSRLRGINPASVKEGWDFSIRLEGEGVCRRFQVNPIEQTPLTPAQALNVAKCGFDPMVLFAHTPVVTEMEPTDLRNHIDLLLAKYGGNPIETPFALDDELVE